MINRFALLERWTIATAVIAGLALFDPPAASAATSITNTGNGDWFATGTWNPAQVPNDGDDVVIASGTVLLTNETKLLSSLTITGSTSTLTFSNWTTRLCATNVMLTNSATITIGSAFTNNAMSNRVWIVCSNLTIHSAAKIDADAKGWAGANGAVSAAGHGPGAGTSVGAAAGYGGSGGRKDAAGATGTTPSGSLPYGSATDPTDPGSGGSATASSGNSGGAGGGAVYVEATGLVTVNGTITANGGNGGTSGCGGSGGGVYVKCNAIQGSGLIRAEGGTAAVLKANGGGGRIAVKYTAASQALLAVPGISFSAATPVSSQVDSEIGTLYFTDNQFLNRSPLTSITGQWSSAVADVGLSSLTMSNAWIRFVTDGIHLTVTNELLLKNGARLDLGGNVINAEWIWDYRASAHTAGTWEMLARPVSEMTSNPKLDCGSLTLTNGGALWVFAGNNNTSVRTGAVVNVTGTMKVFTNSWVYPVSHLTNGGSVRFALGGLTIQQGGGFNAEGLGYGTPRNNVNTIGYGPGPGRYSSTGYGNFQGGGYGGFGGGYTNTQVYGITNGLATLPLDCGSGGGSSGTDPASRRAGSGGGLVWIEAPAAIITVDGTISAKGGDYRGKSGSASMIGGAGAGGGIYIRCKGITGATSGMIVANGGNMSGAASTSTASGGGGRIALWLNPAFNTYLGTTNATFGTNATYNGTAGTIVFLPDPNIPVVSNQAPASFDSSSAAMVGYLSSTGSTPTTLFCFWGTNDGGTVKAIWMTNDSLGVRSVGYYTNSVSGLSSTTEYYYRFYASNSWSDAWAPTSNKFTTTGGLLVNNNGGATDITTTSAKLQGEVIASSSRDAYVCWGPSDHVENSTSVWEHVDYAGNLSGAFSKNIAGLLANKTYYYRCYATNTVEGGSAWAPSSTNFPTASPNLLITDASVTEGNAGDYPQLSFGITLSATSAIPVSVGFSTSNGTATAGSDFTFTGGTLTIPAGIVSTSIAVTVTGDITDEFPYETLYVVLSNAVSVNPTRNTALGTINDDDDQPGPKTWNGNGDWTTHTNWVPFGQPSPSDAVTIQSGNLLLASPQTVASVIVSNSATLTFTNWSTKLTVSEDMTVRSNATVTLPAAFTNGMMSNRVWIACSTLAVQTGGKIDVDGKGFAGASGAVSQAGHGPGAGLENKSAGGYGGSGGRQEPVATGGSLPYGTVSAPEQPGSGGGSTIGGSYYGGAGGGAVRIEASSGVTVDGTITANGSATVNFGAPGSGGGIYITCSTITGTGVVRADGASVSSGGIFTRSGGGRIAVDYTPSQQALITIPPLMFSAGTPRDGGTDNAPGDIGTLYFPDNRLLQRNPLTGLTGQWHSASANLGLSELTISNSWLRLVNDGIRVTVTNSLTLGSGARLEIGGNVINSNVWWDRQSISYKDVLPRPMSEMTANPALTCGSLSMANGSALWVYAGLAPATSVTGATVTVSGMLTVASNAWIYPVSHATNGGSVFFSVVDMNLAAGGGINAIGLGQACKANWSPAGGYGSGSGYQWISGSTAIGGGHGGTGGNAQTILGQPYGQVYGASNLPPFYCGSGGGANQFANTYRGGSGGGLVWINAQETVTLNGTFTANGGNCMAQSGAGSGGGIYLTCFTLAGTGTMQANGGSAESATGSGTGGGGRIAVFRMTEFDTFTGVGSYSYAAGTNGASSGAVGTLSLSGITRGTVFKFR